MLAARNALNPNTEVVDVVSSHARACAESFARHQPTDAPVSTRLADDMACHTPNPEALEIIREGVSRIVEVTDLEIAEAMRVIFECTHNASEGAGLAGNILQRRQENRRRSQRRKH